MSEATEQIRFAKWLNAQGVLWVHAPNEGRRSYRTGKLLKAMGLKAGFPDVAIFARRAGESHDVRGWAIEFKRPDNKPTKNQQRWLADLKRAGWRTTVAYSADEAIAWCRREWGLTEESQLEAI